MTKRLPGIFHHLHAHYLGKRFHDETVENERMLAFLSAKQHIRRHNDAYERGDVSFKLGLNHISDLVGCLVYPAQYAFNKLSFKMQTDVLAFLRVPKAERLPPRVR